MLDVLVAMPTACAAVDAFGGDEIDVACGIEGGVGAAPLRARRCEGCRMQINASDLGVIAKAPADEVVRCEECQRILVRTSESGI